VKCDEKFGIRQEYGPLIQRLSKKIKYLAEENLVKHKITLEQVKILKFLAAKSKELTVVYQKDIETEFDVKRSSVTSILQNMEKSGLISRESDQEDARIKRVILTEKGIKLSILLKDYIENLEATIVKDMTTEEKEIFTQLLKRALNNVESLTKEIYPCENKNTCRQ
jgi:DNA-binding MarR family transcriptional regulator